MNQQMLKQIGARIMRRRKQLGYTQEQLAELMNVSIQMISNLERGNKAIRIDNLINLCAILQVSTDYILTGAAAAAGNSPLAEQIGLLSDEQQDMIRAMVGHCLSQNS